MKNILGMIAVFCVGIGMVNAGDWTADPFAAVGFARDYGSVNASSVRNNLPAVTNRSRLGLESRGS